MNWWIFRHVRSTTNTKSSSFRQMFEGLLFRNIVSMQGFLIHSRQFYHTKGTSSTRLTCSNCLKHITRSASVLAISGPGNKEDILLHNHKHAKVRHLHRTGTFCTTSTKKAYEGRQPLKILFFGTDKFSVRVLQILDEFRTTEDGSFIEKLDVLSNTGQTRVRQFATSAGLTVLEWPVPDLTGQYNLGVLASFGHLIPSRVINMFEHGILNVHPSLLPRWRGASPIVHTLLAGDQTTGVSIMKLRPKHFDTGPLLCQEEVSVPDQVTSLQLRELLAQQGGQLLVRVLQTVCDTEEQEQRQEGVTYAHKVPTQMTYVNWTSETCEDVARHYRAFGEFLDLRSELNGQTVKLIGLQRIDMDPGSDPPGTLMFSKQKQVLCVSCKDGWLGFEKIVIKKTMTAQAFYNGYISKMADKKLFLTSVKNGLDKETYNKQILERR